MQINITSVRLDLDRDGDALPTVLNHLDAHSLSPPPGAAWTVCSSAWERERIGRLRHAHDQLRTAVGALVLRRAAGPRRAVARAPETGKPWFYNSRGIVHTAPFNLSHHGHWVVLAELHGVQEEELDHHGIQAIGVDVTTLDAALGPKNYFNVNSAQELLSVFGSVLADHERTILAAASQPRVVFAISWAIKEAVLKCQGVGIAADMGSLSLIWCQNLSSLVETVWLGLSSSPSPTWERAQVVIEQETSSAFQVWVSALDHESVVAVAVSANTSSPICAHTTPLTVDDLLLPVPQ
ncbi:hypothetical protein BC828DRAFT_374225 [Blastocladiella britannica]|nr:hypothetical protein BC828DRAFT_374225 [Blastocladiella britannica]